MLYTAILDLKLTYDTVSRDRLMTRVKERISTETSSMVSVALQPLTVTTVGGESSATAKITKGVTKGSFSSLPIYNVQMDTLPETVAAAVKDRPSGSHGIRHAIVLYADDAKLQAVSQEEQQYLLDAASNWATEERMTWNIKKCHVLQPPNAPPHLT